MDNKPLEDLIGVIKNFNKSIRFVASGADCAHFSYACAGVNIKSFYDHLHQNFHDEYEIGGAAAMHIKNEVNITATRHLVRFRFNVGIAGGKILVTRGPYRPSSMT